MDDENYRKVIIKNIPYEIGEDALTEWCSTFGPISSCQLKFDRFRKSRGFAFVTFASIDGHNNILSQAPHYCLQRLLTVKSTIDPLHPNEYPTHSSPDSVSQTISSSSANEYCHSMMTDQGFIDDNINDNQLVSLRDELDANLECMQITHEQEIKVLREKLEREKKLKNEAEELFKEAEDDLRKATEENIRLRTSLIKNVMQTFNIRKNLARKTKNELKQCKQIEQQCQELQANQMVSK